MSYVKANTGNTLNDMFKNMAQFNFISNNLLTAKTKDAFEVWFEKAEQMDKRSLYLFLCKNKNNIPKEYLEMVRYRFAANL